MNNGQPISVKEAVEAVQAVIEVMSRIPPPLTSGSLMHPLCNFDRPWMATARAGYAGALEFLLREVEEHQTEHIYPRQRAYAAIAPIVEWHRAQGGRG